MIPTFLGSTILVFTILQLAPGGPLEQTILQLQMGGFAGGGEGGGGSAAGIDGGLLMINGFDMLFVIYTTGKR